ncbi:MAG TPA: restriction endonuclease subunit S [Defluviitoga tunisiensis]|nr:restriction endonuclease subunit S [Defluviitoga tunisiensis]
MSRLNQLIQELCPDGVEYRRLKDVCTFRRGTSITKKDIIEGNIPVIAGGQEPAYYHNQANRTGETVVISSSGAAGFVSYWEQPIFVSDAFSVEPNGKILTKYLYYFLKSKQDKIYSLQKAGGVPHVYSTDIAPLKIPIPPLPVQQEIVRILDTFTELIKELNAELEARRKQYEYYRDTLLNFTDEYETKQFGEIATIVRGASPRPIRNFITDDPNGVNWIKIGDVQPGSKYITSTNEKITQEGARKSRLVHPGDFILSNSMSFGRPYIMKIKGCIHDGWLAITGFEEYFMPDFLYHLLSSAPIQKVLAQRASTGTVKNLNADIVKALELPVPPLEEQQRIVNILDRFDTLINDPITGIPAEIEAREKQFKYYLNKLLDFKEVSS